MKDERGRTALDLAVWGRHASVVRLLLAAGADPEQRIGEFGEETPLRFAAAQGAAEIVELLLDAGAMPDYRLDPTRATPLMVAAAENQADIVRMLLDHGADLKLRGRDKTALEWARGRGPDATAVLLSRGAVDATSEARKRKSPPTTGTPRI
ncbi:ankyrin repeat protein [Streptomyces sp. LBL]|nr:ankyrin repeat protein [Streptomyces sp. LBL]